MWCHKSQKMLESQMVYHQMRPGDYDNEMNVEATLILLHKLLFFGVWKKTKLLVDCDEL